MKLPTVKGRATYYPKKPLCPWCQKKKVFEPHSFAILAGGAMLMDRKEQFGAPDDDMDGFLSLGWHGAHDNGEGKDREIDAIVNIATSVRSGQFDLYFCSTKCLRAYLNYCVDTLEIKIKKQRDK